MNTNKKLNPLVLILAIFLVAFDGIALIFFYLKFIPFGGYDSQEELVTDFEKAVNKGDVDLYLELLHYSERTTSEKDYLEDNLESYSGKDYDFNLDRCESMGKSDVLAEDFTRFIVHPFSSPVLSDYYMVKSKTTDSAGKVYNHYFYIYKVGNKYFLEDTYY